MDLTAENCLLGEQVEDDVLLNGVVERNDLFGTLFGLDALSIQHQ